MDTLMIATAVVLVMSGIFALRKLSQSRTRTYFYGAGENPESFDFSHPELQREYNELEQRMLTEIQRLKDEYKRMFERIDEKMEITEQEDSNIQMNNTISMDDIQYLDAMWNKSKSVQSKVVDNNENHDHVDKPDDELIQETLEAIKRFSQTLDRLSKTLKEEEEKQQNKNHNRSDKLDI